MLAKMSPQFVYARGDNDWPHPLDVPLQYNKMDKRKNMQERTSARPTILATCQMAMNIGRNEILTGDI